MTMGALKKKTINILLVEDDEVEIQSIHRAINKTDLIVQLDVARDGIEALNHLSTLMPHLIIMDINMPKMSGIELLETLRKNPKINDAKIIILTTSTDLNDRVIFS